MILCDVVPVLYFKGEVAIRRMISAAALKNHPWLCNGRLWRSIS